MFALELNRRLNANGSHVVSLASHPGYANTSLQRHSLMWRLFNTVALSPKRGAAATVFAATEAEALDHPYWGRLVRWRHGVGPVEPTSASVLNASTTLRRCGPGRRR